MSDCRVPMPVYSKELLKDENTGYGIPPIPDGWIAVSVPEACLTVDYERGIYGGATIRIEGLNIETVFNNEQDFNPQSKVDVLVLVREHK